MKRWGRLGLVMGMSIPFLQCSPPQTINIKEKVIERYAPPAPALNTDRFLYNKAEGKADVLFVVDNTESIEPGLGEFRQGYQRFVAKLRTEPARLIDYRVHVVATPSDRSAGNFIAREKTDGQQLAELFDGHAPIGHTPLFTQDTTKDYREKGYPYPLSSTLAGLGHPAFKDRNWQPLFLVYLVAHDHNPGLPDDFWAEQREALKVRIESTRGFHQTHLMTLSRTSEIPGIDAFPHCQEFFVVRRLLKLVEGLPWGSVVQPDLCHKTWGNWDAELFSRIMAAKTRLVLTKVPFEPWTMVLRGGNRSFRYGDDYEVDARTNEIVFKVAADLQSGDLVEATYFLKPNDPQIPGGTTPPGTPTPPVKP